MAESTAGDTVKDQGKDGTKRLHAVAVYCGAAPNFKGKKLYLDSATELGACLAGRGVEVVYGGGRFGLLGAMGEAVVANGGKLTGIMPEFFQDFPGYEPVSNDIIVPDMHTRKKMMFDRVDAFIALPGGIGTMEELTEILTWAKLQLHSKPVALLNADGYYDHFLQWLSRGIEDGFIHSSASPDEMMIISTDPRELVDTLCAQFS